MDGNQAPFGANAHQADPSEESVHYLDWEALLSSQPERHRLTGVRRNLAERRRALRQSRRCGLSPEKRIAADLVAFFGEDVIGRLPQGMTRRGVRPADVARAAPRARGDGVEERGPAGSMLESWKKTITAPEPGWKRGSGAVSLGEATCVAAPLKCDGLPFVSPYSRKGNPDPGEFAPCRRCGWGSFNHFHALPCVINRCNGLDAIHWSEGIQRCCPLGNIDESAVPPSQELDAQDRQ